MTQPTQAIVLAIFVLATSVWVGGYVAIAVVARSAAKSLDPADRVKFFRSLGRSYLVVGSIALVVALATGAILLPGRDAGALLISTIAVAAILVLLLIVAVAQARKMTRLRRRRLTDTDPYLAEQISRGGRTAAILRAALGLLTVCLVVLGSFLTV